MLYLMEYFTIKHFIAYENGYQIAIMDYQHCVFKQNELLMKQKLLIECRC